MKILERIESVPGGLMVIPLILGVCINTFKPSILQIGSFTTAIFSSEGLATFVGICLFCVGTNFKVSDIRESIKRGGVLLTTKILYGAFLGFIFTKCFGMEGIFGVSTVAVIAASTNSNLNLYLTLVNQYGDEKDLFAQSILNINTGPFFTLIILGLSGMAEIPIMSLIGAIGPLVVGVILGNLDEKIGELFNPGIKMLIPFIGFCIGTSINFSDIINSGFPGIVLSLIVLTGAIPLILVDRIFNKRPGYAGAALSSTAGNAVATPISLALLNNGFEKFVDSATMQIASAVIITIILTPLLTMIVVNSSKNKLKNT